MTIYCTNQSLGHNSGKRLILQKTTCRRNGTRGYWHLRAFSKHSVANGFIFSVIIHVQCHSRENIMKSIWLSIKAHANLYCIYIIDKRWSAANFCGSNINDKIKWNENNSKHIQNCSTLINGIFNSLRTYNNHSLFETFTIALSVQHQISCPSSHTAST